MSHHPNPNSPTSSFTRINGKLSHIAERYPNPSLPYPQPTVTLPPPYPLPYLAVSGPSSYLQTSRTFAPSPPSALPPADSSRGSPCPSGRKTDGKTRQAFNIYQYLGNQSSFHRISSNLDSQVGNTCGANFSYRLIHRKPRYYAKKENSGIQIWCSFQIFFRKTNTT